MADSGFDSQSKCRICLSNYTEPRLLDCFHRFCSPCIEELIKDKVKFHCPLCRADIIVPNVGLSGFGLCIKERIVDNKQKGNTTLCELCDDGNLAVAKCLNCDEFLCKSCHKGHQKLKVLKDHKYEFLIETENSISQEKDHIKNETDITCDVHNENLSLFCKPCNKVICCVCCTSAHKKHVVMPITRAATKERDILMAAIGGLTAKVPILNNTMEIIKTEEETFYKHTRQVKEEIMCHATGLKEVFCKTIDFIMKNNLEAVDKIQTAEIKQIETFFDEIETERISFACMLHTANDLVSNSSDIQLLNMSTNLKRRLTRALQQPEKTLQLNNIQYNSSDLNKSQINSYAGYVQRVEHRKLKPTFRALPIPDLQTVKELSQVSSFYTGARSLAADKNGLVWLLHNNAICGLYTRDGKLQNSSKKVDLGPYSRLVKAPDGSVLLWLQTSAFQLSPTLDQEKKLFQVSFQNAIPCCFIDKENLLVYNVNEKSFVVVSEGHESLKEIKSENLSNVLSSDNLYAAQTKSSTIIIVQKTNLIVINSNGDIVNKTTSNSGYNFENICIDEYENVLVSEYGTYNILLYSPEGHFQRVVLNCGYYYQYMTIDDCGNLWISDNSNNNTKVYSYL